MASVGAVDYKEFREQNGLHHALLEYHFHCCRQWHLRWFTKAVAVAVVVGCRVGSERCVVGSACNALDDSGRSISIVPGDW
jgi:hypothetical protein